jgi:hypothetical protein
MTKILVKNGDWDKARLELGAVLDAKKNNFNAQFNAAFGAPKKAPAPAAEPARPAVSASPLILSRKR